MPTISFSSGLTSAFNASLMEFTANGSYSGTSNPFSDAGFMRQAANQNVVASVFYIMKGTVPTDFTGLTNVNVRQSDILMTFDTIVGTGGTPNTTSDFAPSNTTSNPLVVSTLYRNASASGTATWFWWLTCNTMSSSPVAIDRNSTIYNQMIGTVGATGSGADLTLPSTSIVAGQAYRVFDMQIQTPTTWTY